MTMTIRRRLVTIPTVFAAVPLWIALSPIAIPVIVIVDVVTGRFALPVLRLWMFMVIFLLHEWAGIVYAAALWVVGGFGRRLRYGPHQTMQGWWSTSLLAWARRLLGVRFDFGGATMPTGQLVVLSRHASMVDAIIPAHLFPTLMGRPVHYILKQELRNIPNIDIYGHRLGNHFVTRGGNTETEINRIAALANSARDNAALVIFPEGTYATAATKARVGASLEARGQDRASRFNAELRHLLPPKTAGAFALLDHCPDASIVVLAHTGLEGMAEFRGLRQQLPLRQPVIVRWWSAPRSDVPLGADARTLWLHDRWREIDDWVERHRVDVRRSISPK